MILDRNGREMVRAVGFGGGLRAVSETRDVKVDLVAWKTVDVEEHEPIEEAKHEAIHQASRQG